MSKWQICFWWLHQKYMLLWEEPSKLCTEGAIGNLMNILHCPKNDMEQFWDIVQSPVHLILQTLGESSVPKAVLKSCEECDSIQKSLWILCKKIKFSTTSVLQIKCFQDLQEVVNILRIMKFSLAILVMGTHACYHHVFVIWRGMIIDYESKYTFPLTNDSLRQVCGVNTSNRRSESLSLNIDLICVSMWVCK